MQTVQVTLQDIPNSPAIEGHLRKKANKLSHFYDRINSCRIVLTLPKKHMHQGKLFCIKIDVKVPGKELVATRQTDEDVYVAIRDAFKAVERQLESYARRRRGHVKSHEKGDHGYIKRVLYDEGYGFIEAADGSELYFSETNVAYPSFHQLKTGDTVDFLTMPAAEGFQAHRITKAKNNNLVDQIPADI